MLQHLPSVRELRARLLLLGVAVVLAQAEHVGTALERDAEQRLGQRVSDLLLGWNVLQLDGAGLDVLSDEEVLHLDVLAALADLAVVGDVHGALAVDEQCRGLRTAQADAAEVVSVPQQLLRGGRDGHQLGLGGRQRDGGLLLALPADRTATHEEHIATGGLALAVLVLRPVSVTVSDELRAVLCCCACVRDAALYCALQVA